MPSVNRATILGHIGREPETRAMPDGGMITNISVATTSTWKDKSGQKQEDTEWHRVAFFGKLAEIAGEYLKKGSQVYIEGKIRTRKWQDKDGNDKYTTEILAENMQMIGSRPPSNSEESDSRASSSRPSKPPASSAAKPAARASRFDDAETGDVPF